MIKKLILTKAHWQAMQQHVNEHAPFEACGLLAGTMDRVTNVLGIENQARSPLRFVMDPQQQLDAFDWIESHGLDLLAIFHSHPAGPETVSATDIVEAAYPVVHIICSLNKGKWLARGYWIEGGQVTEVSLEIV